TLGAIHRPHVALDADATAVGVLDEADERRTAGARITVGTVVAAVAAVGLAAAVVVVAVRVTRRLERRLRPARIATGERTLVHAAQRGPLRRRIGGRRRLVAARFFVRGRAGARAAAPAQPDRRKHPRDHSPGCNGHRKSLRRRTSYLSFTS